MIKKTNKNLIIAGNGPSLARINPNSMPDDFDVFRCNQFYAEDKYFLGKKIKLAMFNPGVINSQLKTCDALIKNNDYEIEQTCLNYFDESWMVNFNIKQFSCKNPNVLILRDLLEQNQDFINYINELTKHNLRLTSGVILIMLGVVCGYENIYFSGIDFYENNDLDTAYSYKISENMKKMIYQKNTVVGNMHNKNTDLNGIDFLTNYAAKKGIKIQRLDDSGVGDLTNFKGEFGLNAILKANNALKDILVVDETSNFF